MFSGKRFVESSSATTRLTLFVALIVSAMVLVGQFKTARMQNSLAVVSAASYKGDALAAEQIAVGFGTNLADGIVVASNVPLPTTLGGTSVKVRDSMNVERVAPLFFVSPTQINYQIPAGTINGTAAIIIASSNGQASQTNVQIARVAPALFTANASGQGVAAAYALRIKANGAQISEPIAQFDQAQSRFVVRPIDLGDASDQVYVILFGSGLRFRSSLTAVSAQVGGTPATVTYVGAQGEFVGLDQANILLPRSLIGRGEVDVVLTVDGQAANTVRISIK